MEQIYFDNIKIEPSPAEEPHLTKCSEVFRNNLSGKYCYFCYHCGNEYDSDEEVIAHLEAEHVLNTNDDVDVKFEEINIEDSDNDLKLQNSQNNENPINCNDNEFSDKNPSNIFLNDDQCIVVGMSIESLPTETITATVLTCNWCDKIFSKKRGLQDHIRRLHYVEWRKANNFDSFYCDICSSSFTTKLRVEDHKIRMHSAESKSKNCQYCGKFFSLRSSLTRHVRQVHIAKDNQKIQTSQQASFKYNESSNKFYEDMSSNSGNNSSNIFSNEDQCTEGGVHDECKPIETIIEDQIVTKEYHCDYCQKVFRHKKSIANHMNVHWDSEEVFTCNWCDKTSHRKRALQDHIRKQHNMEWRKTNNYDSFSCDICPSSFTTKFKVEDHKKRKHSSELLLNNCQYCGRYFSKRNSLNKHVRDVHIAKSNLNINCRVCNERFQDFQKYKEHKLLHSHLKSFKCDMCDKVFRSYAYLVLHKSRHNAVPVHNCTLCSATFIDKYNLMRHIRQHTEGRKLYNCDLCDKSYTVAFSLKIHKRSHTGEKPFQCALCGHKYVQRGQLTNHMSNVHNERKHQCATCGKKFTTSYRLRAHEHLHTGLKQFKCDICDRTFAQKRGLRAHQMLHQDVKRYKCKYCDMVFAQPSGRRGHEKNKHLHIDDNNIV